MGDSPLAYALFGTTVVGVILVPVIQKITDRYTNYKYGPVKEISESAKWGYASLTLMGIIKGLQSTGPFMIALALQQLVQTHLCSKQYLPNSTLPLQLVMFQIFHTKLPVLDLVLQMMQARMRL